MTRNLVWEDPDLGPPPEPTLRGFVRSLQPQRGFGFLVDESGVERFFHVSQLTGARLEDLRVGQAVYFIADADLGKGPRARAVRP